MFKVTFLSIAAMVFSSVLLIDNLLPTTSIHTKVIKCIFKGSRNDDGLESYSYGIQTKEGNFAAPTSLFHNVQIGDSVIIDKTMLLHIAKRFYLRKSIYDNGRVFTFYKIPLIAFFILSVVCFRMRKVVVSEILGKIFFLIFTFFILFYLVAEDFFYTS